MNHHESMCLSDNQEQHTHTNFFFFGVYTVYIYTYVKPKNVPRILCWLSQFPYEILSSCGSQAFHEWMLRTTQGGAAGRQAELSAEGMGGLEFSLGII